MHVRPANLRVGTATKKPDTKSATLRHKTVFLKSKKGIVATPPPIKRGLASPKYIL
jgi:hypothetical protein